MSVPEQAVSARVAAAAPLMRRGLVRAAEAAGFIVVGGDAAADVTVRIIGPGEPTGLQQHGAAVDVVVERDAVVLTVHSTPDLAMTLMLRGLLSVLLDARPVTSR